MTTSTVSKTLFDKIWDTHVVGQRPDGRTLIYMDRHVIDDVRAPHAFKALEQQGRRVRRTDLTFAVQDHSVRTDESRHNADPAATTFTDATRAAAGRHGVRLFDVDDPEQGILARHRAGARPRAAGRDACLRG